MIFEFGYTTGQMLTAQLFAVGSDTVVATASSVVEATNRKGRYVATFATIAPGDYLMVYSLGGVGAGSEVYRVAEGDTHRTPNSESLSSIDAVADELAKVPRAPVAIAAGTYRLTIEGGQSQNLTPGAPTP